jgi:hypothetical protein
MPANKPARAGRLEGIVQLALQRQQLEVLVLVHSPSF